MASGKYNLPGYDSIDVDFMVELAGYLAQTDSSSAHRFERILHELEKPGMKRSFDSVIFDWNDGHSNPENVINVLRIIEKRLGYAD